MTTEPQCPRCNAPLPTTRVREPVYLEHNEIVHGELITEQVLIRFDWVDQAGDCPRCQGAY